MVTYKVIHTMTYTSPILSIANSVSTNLFRYRTFNKLTEFLFLFQNDDKTLVTGTVSGLITIQKRGEQVIEPQKKPVSYRYIGDTSTKDRKLIDTVVSQKDKDKLTRYEFDLRKFQYAKALDHVMIPSLAYKYPATVVTLFDELIR